MKKLICDDDLKKIYCAAKNFQDKLNNKVVVLFCETSDKKISSKSILFESNKFAQFIGCSCKDEKSFYEKALNEMLVPYSDFCFEREVSDERFFYDKKNSLFEKLFNILKNGSQLEVAELDVMFDRCNTSIVKLSDNSTLEVELSYGFYYPQEILKRTFESLADKNSVAKVLAVACVNLEVAETQKLKLCFMQLDEQVKSSQAKEILNVVKAKKFLPNYVKNSPFEFSRNDCFKKFENFLAPADAETVENLRQFEILSDGEEIPVDNEQRKKSKTKVYKRTEMWEQSRTGRHNKMKNKKEKTNNPFAHKHMLTPEEGVRKAEEYNRKHNSKNKVKKTRARLR